MKSKNELIGFYNQLFGNLEVLNLDGKLYFPATRVAEILGYANPYAALSQHCIREEPHLVKREVGVQSGVYSNGLPIIQTVQKNFVNEENLNRLIAGSKLPNAEAFKTWVFGEVVPMIARTGMYVTDEMVEEFINSPKSFDIVVDKYIEARNQLREAKPKLETYERIMSSDTGFNMATTSKILRFQAPQRKNKVIGRNQMFQILRELNILQSDKRNWNLPFQDFVDQGYFSVLTKDYNGNRINATVFVLPRGIEFIMHLLEDNGYELVPREPIPEKYNNLLAEVM